MRHPLKKIKPFWTHVTFFLLFVCSCIQTSRLETYDRVDEEGGSVSLSDTLAFNITNGNNIVFEVVLDGKDTLDFYFDTGGTDLVIKHDAIENKTTRLRGRNDNYHKDKYVPMGGTYSFSIGNLHWDGLTIYPVSTGPDEADGHFGWNLFDGKIVELDYDKRWMIIHDSLSRDMSAYSRSKIEYINTLFCIQGDIIVGSRRFTDRYLFDSGFQKAVLLDKDLREKAGFPIDLPVLKETVLRNSLGTEFINKLVRVDSVCFGSSCGKDVPVLQLSTSNPARFETHILGNEFLKRFNTFLDFKNHLVYMRPNSLMAISYVF